MRVRYPGMCDACLFSGSLRDDNESMSATEFWHGLPTSIRASIEALGPVLGTGSVKQVTSSAHLRTHNDLVSPCNVHLCMDARLLCALGKGSSQIDRTCFVH